MDLLEESLLCVQRLIDCDKHLIYFDEEATRWGRDVFNVSTDVSFVKPFIACLTGTSFS